MYDIGTAFTNKGGSWPNWTAKNVTAPGAGDGTEFIAALVNDIWGVHQAIMAYAGLSPNGVTEAAGANPTTAPTSQILEAMHKGFAVGPGIGVTYWKSGSPAANGDRVILLQGQVVLIANYPLLAAACYCGDTLNPTAPAFYKVTDVGGLTRSTSGTYMVIPDTRGLSLKGVGNHTINAGVKTGPASIGAILEDSFQGFNRTFTTLVASAGGNGSSYVMGAGGASVLLTIPNGSGATQAIVTDGVNGLPRTGAQTQDCTIGTNFGITY